MASAVIGAVRIDVGMDSAKLSSGADLAEQRLQTFGRRTSATLNTMASTIKGTMAGLVGALTIDAVARAIGSAVDQASKLVDIADRLRITTQSLQELGYAAQQNGSDFETLVSAMTKFGQGVAEAQSGGGELLRILKANGISLTDNAGRMKSLDALFIEYIDLIGRAKNATDAARLAQVGLGKGAADLGTLARGGAAGIKALADESHRYGLINTEEQLRRLEDMGDQFSKLGNILKSVVIAGVANTAQAFEDLWKKMFPAEKDPTKALAAVDAEIAKITNALAMMDKALPNGGLGLLRSQLEDGLQKAQALRAQLEVIANGGAAPLHVDVNTGKPGPAAVLPPDQSVLAAQKAAADKLKTEQEAQAQRLEILRTSLLTEAEAEQENYGERLNAIMVFENNKSITYDQAREMERAATEQHNKKLEELDQESRQKRLAIASGYANSFAGILDGLSGIVGQESQKQFEISKKLSIASAVIKGLEAVVSAYAYGQNIGGPILGGVFAAAAAATTAAQIAAISRQTFSGGGGSTAAVPSAAAATPPPVAAPEPQQSVNIAIHGDVFNREGIRKLIEQINSATKLGSRLTISPA